MPVVLSLVHVPNNRQIFGCKISPAAQASLLGVHPSLFQKVTHCIKRLDKDNAMRYIGSRSRPAGSSEWVVRA